MRCFDEAIQKKANHFAILFVEDNTLNKELLVINYGSFEKHKWKIFNAFDKNLVHEYQTNIRIEKYAYGNKFVKFDFENLELEM